MFGLKVVPHKDLVNLTPSYGTEIPRPITMTQNPTLIGTSIVAFYYKGGVILAADTNLGYGGMAYVNGKADEKIVNLNEYTVIAANGDIADFQDLTRKLLAKETDIHNQHDNILREPKEYCNYIGRIQYQYRNKVNPLYMTTVVCGYHNKERYIGYSDMYGNSFEKTNIVTGLAYYFCLPLITNHWNPDMSLEDAKHLIKECFKVLFVKDTRAADKIVIVTLDEKGISKEEVRLELTWNYNEYVKKPLYYAQLQLIKIIMK